MLLTLLGSKTSNDGMRANAPTIKSPEGSRVQLARMSGAYLFWRKGKLLRGSLSIATCTSALISVSPLEGSSM